MAGAAIVSVVVGERADAGIILAIVGLSVGLGFVNEYRSEKAVEELHSSIRHTAVTTRGGRVTAVDVTELVPGDVVGLESERWCRRICGCWKRTRWSATSPR